MCIRRSTRIYGRGRTVRIGNASAPDNEVAELHALLCLTEPAIKPVTSWRRFAD